VGGAKRPAELAKKQLKVIGEYTIHDEAANRIYKNLHLCALLRSALKPVSATLGMRNRLRNFQKGLAGVRKTS